MLHTPPPSLQKKTLVVVQCRYNSSRLCGKALFPLAGVPMVVFLLRRLLCGLDQEEYRVVLATSTNPLDQAVARWGISEGVDVVTGDEEDVLCRYLLCLEKYPCNTVVRVTADNPLTCPQVLVQMVNEHHYRELDYLTAEKLPYGAGVDVFSASVVSKLGILAKKPAEREHLNLHILENPGGFKSAVKHFVGDIAREDLSMTVDSWQDWQRVSALFNEGEKKPWKISLQEAIARMDFHNIRRKTAS